MTPVDLQKLLAEGPEGGWATLDRMAKQFGASPAQRKAREKADLDRRLMAETAARIFEGDDGERFLEWMLDQTWRRFTFAIASHPDPQQALLYGAFREGQNALALTILRMIAEGRAETPPTAKE